MNIPGDTTERLVISAFKDGAAVAAIARRIGKKPGSVTWILQKAGLKPARRQPRRLGIDDSSADVQSHEDRKQSFVRQDLAFQRAMRRAIAQGCEHPPMLGIFKDPRPLDASRRFAPVLYSSGCTSPALICADNGLSEPDPDDPDDPDEPGDPNWFPPLAPMLCG
jgi:hypothetical protein